MQPLSSPEDRLERQATIGALRDTTPEMLEAHGEALTLEAFQRVARTVPAYAEALRAANVDPRTVDSIAAFVASAPLLDKHNTFGAHSISALSTDGNLDGLRSLLTSSGHSGVFSFGVNTRENVLRSARSIDTVLQYLFNVDQRHTLFINCLPMGVKVHTNATVLAETSVRADMVYAVVRKFGSEFDQIVMVGEGSFIKKIVEDGAEQHGIDWHKLTTHVVTGEEGIAENYRTYLAALLGISDIDNPADDLIMSSMGVAELDLNIFHETREAMRIRRLAHRDPMLRHSLFGDNVRCCPMFFVRYPSRCFVETIDAGGGHDELVISMLSPEMKLPLLRYRAGDFGRLLSYRQVVATLRAHGLDIVPDLKLPFLAVYGRGQALAHDGGRILPEAVKEALYADHAIAASITGNFRLWHHNGVARLDVQLREDHLAVPAAEDRLMGGIVEYSDTSPDVIAFHPYAAFAYNMGVDWERKFAYLKSD
jgi:phenylacetate-CoA ligase